MEIFILKPLVIGKLSLFSGIQNDASIHREGLNGYVLNLHILIQNREGLNGYVLNLHFSIQNINCKDNNIFW